MGLRSARRAIAKARLQAIGVDRVNRRLKVVDADTGLAIWRKVLMDSKAHDAQAQGKKPVLLNSKRKARKMA